MTDTNESLKVAEAGSHPKAEKYGATDDNAALVGGQIAADIERSKALAKKA